MHKKNFGNYICVTFFGIRFFSICSYIYIYICIHKYTHIHMHIYIYIYIYILYTHGWVCLVYGISTFVGYLMPNPFLCK